MHGGQCQDDVDDFVCACQEGYSGTYCECRDGDNLGRIVDTTQRTRAAVKEDVQRAVAPLNAKIERLEALLQQALLRDTSRLRR